MATKRKRRPKKKAPGLGRGSPGARKGESAKPGAETSRYVRDAQGKWHERATGRYVRATVRRALQAAETRALKARQRRLAEEERRIAETAARLAQYQEQQLVQALRAQEQKAKRAKARAIERIRAAEAYAAEETRLRRLAQEDERRALEEAEEAEAQREALAALRDAESRKRSEAARRGWESRRKREQAAQDKREKLRAAAAKRPRRADGRFATRKQAAAAERERFKRQRREQAEADKLKRRIAGEKGWETILQKAKRKRKALGEPSDALRAEFTDPRWQVCDWYSYEDGQQEGQIQIGAGPTNLLNYRLQMLEQALRPKLEGEPVWVECGFTFTGLDVDLYDRFQGLSCTSLYPRRTTDLRTGGSNLGEIFSDQRRLAEALIESGASMHRVFVNVHYGDRPERMGE